LILGCLAAAAAPGSSPIIDRVEETGFVRIEANGFAGLDAHHKALAYWLYEAAIAIDPIAYDQFSRFGLREKCLLEGIAAHGGTSGEKILPFTKLFWANHGNHHDSTAQKILPGFSAAELAAAAHAAQKRGAFRGSCAGRPALRTALALDRELSSLEPALFDPDFEPMLTVKSPKPGEDILQAGSNTFYAGVSLADLNGFTERHPLNSRLWKSADGTLNEEIYRAGTPDGRVPPGLYARYLRRAVGYLARAQAFADPAQARVIGDLIRYFRTGEPADWLQFGIDWVQNDATVDFDNGFVEVYRDARAAKGSAEAFVSITDRPLTDAMSRLAANAEHFEARAPWDPRYKRQSFKPPLVKAVQTLVETGDFPVNIIGDNLPNENAIHEKFGTKNFLIVSSSRALNAASGHRAFREFAATPEVALREERYGGAAQDLLVAMHEVIGHGSGRLSDRLTGGAEPYLKEYYSTLEEGRADLMALWNVGDPKLAELGLVSDQDEVAKTMYDSAAMAPLTQLRRIPHGETIEEDHQRDRQLIVNYIRDKVPGAIGQIERDGKTFVEVQDYNKMREGVGMLLAELMRIKAEGDYAAIKALVDAYGVHFDGALRDQVVQRYRSLDLPAYWAGVYARLRPHFSKKHILNGVTLDYPAAVEQQYLSFGAMYDPSLTR
jgi:dipeptidyl-peptidase-3